nr:MAG TPA: RNA ligase [Caudoviricetes sp.]
MRVLLLFRGAPGCGKSTYIKEYGLADYTLSADTIRMQCSSPVLDVDGDWAISQKNDKVVWDMLFQMLELRMQAGCFTVIDATNSKTTEMNRYKALAKQYRYRTYLIDMTDLPIVECKRRNAQRAPIKRVPEEVIDKMYARFATKKIPGGIQVVTPDTALETMRYRQADLSQYKTIHIIGDIHGCNTALQQLMQKFGGIRDDSFYIFCGDYIDRGLENAQVVQFLLSIMDKPNVTLLEGNHERWLYDWSHDRKAKSPEFEIHTRLELENAGIDKKQVSRLYQRLNQCSWFTYHGKDVFVCHGGVSNFDTKDPLGLISIPTFQLIHGVGRYPDLPQVMAAWNHTGIYQVAGHRNIQEYDIFTENTSYITLEGRVEFGGHLRAVTLDHTGFIQHKIKNDVYRAPDETAASIKPNTTVQLLVSDLRREPEVRESKFGNLSAFNFTSAAFRNSHWNDLTTVARGLFINTEKYEIVARGYEKFFRVDELARVYNYPHSNLDYLKDKLKFPINVYLKENGYLGLLCYDPEIDDLRFCTKGSISGNYAERFYQLFRQTCFSDVSQHWNDLKDFLKMNNCTMLFEVIDQQFDPHIIEYDTPHLILLDIVYNEIGFRKMPYNAWIGDDLIGVSQRFNLNLKKYVNQFMDWQQFYDFYSKASATDYQYEGSYVEGFVFEDAAGFMTKLKTDYYSFWKYMRGIATAVRHYGSIQHTSALTTAQANLFYGFLRDKYTKDEAFRDRTNSGYNIISLRQEFFASQGAAS